VQTTHRTKTRQVILSTNPMLHLSMRSLAKGVEIYHGFRGYEQKANQFGVVAFHVELVVGTGPVTMADLNHEQRRYVQALNDGVDHALKVHNAPEAEAQRLIQENRPKVQVCFGPPGTGKTAVTYLSVDYALRQGGYVLFSVYTAQMASRIRQLFANHPLKRQIRIDTCHSCFGLDQEFVDAPILFDYALIVVDEIGQLNGNHTDDILKLRNIVDCVPAMGFVGDKWQMAGFGDRRPWDSVLWKRATFTHKLVHQFRCKDPAFQELLDMLRTNKPEGAQWTKLKREFLRTNKAWEWHEPDVSDVRRLLLKHPDATLLAITREAVELLNSLAIEAKYPRRAPIIVIGGDLESNPANYDENKRLLPERSLQPLRLPIHVGMQVYMTRNVRKDCDYVNGMRCTVESYDAERNALRVITATGRRVAIVSIPDDKYKNKYYFPVRPGYASTILRFQGAELPFVIVWIDVPHVPAAAYTAMSRVKFKKHCLVGGALTADHFTPSR
jgi:hypothetical protein